MVVLIVALVITQAVLVLGVIISIAGALTMTTAAVFLRGDDSGPDPELPQPPAPTRRTMIRSECSWRSPPASDCLWVKQSRASRGRLQTLTALGDLLLWSTRWSCAGPIGAADVGGRCTTPAARRVTRWPADEVSTSTCGLRSRGRWRPGSRTQRQPRGTPASTMRHPCPPGPRCSPRCRRPRRHRSRLGNPCRGTGTAGFGLC